MIEDATRATLENELGKEERERGQEQQEEKGENVLGVYDLGFRKNYKAVWDFQKELLTKRIEGRISDSVIVVEHDHVLTLGRSSHPENVLVRDLPIFEIERGGDVTYHGPGQLVMYPVVSLQNRRRSLGIKQFVELLEGTVIDAISTFGIRNAEGKLGPETGVWIDNKRKIASIGVAVSHWVTYHGVALNVNTNLSYFYKIKPCGFDSTVMTSLSRELSVGSVDMAQVKQAALQALAKRLSLNMQFEQTVSPSTE